MQAQLEIKSAMNEFADALDKTPSGKLKKQALREAGAGDRTWDREAAGHRLPVR